MDTLIIPFPLSRRCDLVCRQADWFLAQPHQAAERNLLRQLRVQRDALVRRGVSPSRADAEVASLDAAIRDRVRGFLMLPEASA